MKKDPTRTFGPRVALSAAAAGVGSVALPLPLPRRERTAKPKPKSTAKPAGTVPRRLGAFVVSLPDHHWLDRLVRGRAWIPVLGILLAGIVATQVEILKLGAGMGQALEQTTSLTNQNEQLRDSVATLGDDQRIERLATAMGMVLPPPGAVGYLAAGPKGNVAGALANIHSPDPSAFVALTPQDGDGALVTGPGTSTLAPLPGAPAAPPTAAPDSSSSTATSSDASTSGATTSGATTSGTSTAASGATSGAQSDNTAQPGPTSTGSTDQSQGTTSQTPATTSQAPATTPQATAPTSPTSSQTGTGQTDSSTGAGTTSQGPATGAAAIQPADSGQQSSGG